MSFTYNLSRYINFFPSYHWQIKLYEFHLYSDKRDISFLFPPTPIDIGEYKTNEHSTTSSWSIVNEDKVMNQLYFSLLFINLYKHYSQTSPTLVDTGGA